VAKVGVGELGYWCGVYCICVAGWDVELLVIGAGC